LREGQTGGSSWEREKEVRTGGKGGETGIMGPKGGGDGPVPQKKGNPKSRTLISAGYIGRGRGGRVELAPEREIYGEGPRGPEHF